MLLKYLVPVLAFNLFACSYRHTESTEPVPVCDNISGTGPLTEQLGLPQEKLANSTGLYSLEDGGKSLIARAWLCDHASKTLDIQYYIFYKDNTGLIACDFIVRAADRGVKVRLIIDDITVKPNYREIGIMDSHPNIEIRVYNPGVKLGKLSVRLKKIVSNAGKLHRRMHTKTFIADRQVAMAGGRNIADEYFDYDREYNFRDRDVLLVGKEVNKVEACFEDFWNHPLCVTYAELANENKKKNQDPARYNKLHRYACDTVHFSNKIREQIRNYPSYFKSMQSAGDFGWVDNASFVYDPPAKNEDRPGQRGCITLDSLVSLIGQAKKSVVIQSPYLILTDDGKKLFSETVKRGVKVKVLTNSLGATDNYEAFSGYQRDREGVLSTGIDVFEFKPDAAVRYKIMTPEVQSVISYSAVYGLHSKCMIIDDKITVIGSFNLDPRSANFNTECIVIVRSENITRSVSRYVEEEFLPENAWHITEDFNPDKEASFRKKIKATSRKVIPKDIL